MPSEFCSTCGEELRWGFRPTKRMPVPTRPGAGYWMHRDPATDEDHAGLFGQRLGPTALAEVQRELDLPRTKVDKDGNEVVYTTRTWKSSKGKAAADQADGKEGAVEALWDGETPEPEVRARPLKPVRDQVPNGTWLVLKPALEAGLEVRRLTYARGPLLTRNGQPPAVRDSWVLGLRASEALVLDGGPVAAVACWLEKPSKIEFEFGFLLDGKTSRRATATEIKDWIKEVRSGQDG